jgi:hypothetical protein
MNNATMVEGQGNGVLHNIHQHKPDEKIQSVQHSAQISYCSEAFEYQPTGQAKYSKINSITSFYADLSGPCVSMAHRDHSLAHDYFLAHDGGIDEIDEASLCRSYPFFLQI